MLFCVYPLSLCLGLLVCYIVFLFIFGHGKSIQVLKSLYRTSITVFKSLFSLSYRRSRFDQDCSTSSGIFRLMYASTSWFVGVRSSLIRMSVPMSEPNNLLKSEAKGKHQLNPGGPSNRQEATVPTN